MRNFPSLTDGELREMLADLEATMALLDEPMPATEAIAWEIEEELHRRRLEHMHDDRRDW